jgi:hypothetical protein
MHCNYHLRLTPALSGGRSEAQIRIDMAEMFESIR